MPACQQGVRWCRSMRTRICAPAYHGSIYNHACPMYRLRERGYRLLQIGIRSLHADEAQRIAGDEGITTYFDRRLQQAEEWRRLLDHLSALEGDVWLTIDMDGFDPALIAGVGHAPAGRALLASGAGYPGDPAGESADQPARHRYPGTGTRGIPGIGYDGRQVGAEVHLILGQGAAF